MAYAQAIAKNVLLLAVCAAACFVPTPLLSVPAGLVLLLFLPGVYVLHCCQPADAAPGRNWLAIPTSLIVMGLALSWVWQWSNDKNVLLVTIIAVNGILLFAATLFTRERSRPQPMFDSSAQQWLLSALVLWFGVGVFLCYWLPSLRGVIHPVGDYVKHHAICLSLDRSPLPLHNMFFAVQADIPCYYYEQFYLFPATLRILAERTISIPFAFGLIAGIVASTFIAMVYLIGRHVLGAAKGALLASACAGFVGGWDAIPTVIAALSGKGMTVVLDAWCPVAWRIHNLSNNFFWSPQHIAAALMFLLCCHLLQIGNGRRWWIVMAPLAATSIFGTAVYHAITTFCAAAIFVLLEWHRTPAATGTTRTRLLSSVALIGLAGIVLMAPRALHYMEMNARYEGGLTLQWDRFPLAFLGRTVQPGPLANWLDAPWVLLVDFGLGALACLLIARQAWSRLWQNDGTRLLLIAGIIGLVSMWVVRSNVNRFDYSFRLASTFTMVIAALCVGFLLQPDMLRNWARPIRRPVLILGIVLGLPVGLYEAPLMAVRTLIRAHPEQVDNQALRFVREHTPPDAVVQRLPSAMAKSVQLTDRRAGAAELSNSHVNVFRPPDSRRSQKAYLGIREAFETASGQAAYETLRAWNVTHVLVGFAELKKYDSFPQFDDTRFEKVYDDDKARVYRLVGPSVSASMPSADAAGTRAN